MHPPGQVFLKTLLQHVEYLWQKILKVVNAWFEIKMKVGEVKLESIDRVTLVQLFVSLVKSVETTRSLSS